MTAGIIRIFCMAVVLTLFSHVSYADEDLSVVVSIKPIHSILSGLLKDITQPILLVDGDQTPYDFRINSDQKKILNNADLFIWVGPELEKSLASVVHDLPAKVQVIEMLSSDDMKILPSRKNQNLRDPFFWMDDRNVIIMLDQLTELLIQIDPQRTHVYTRNRREMLQPLKRIDKEYEYGYRGMKAGAAVQYYDMLNYFEQAYALQNLDRVAGSPWDRLDVADLLRVRGRINNAEAECLLIDESMYQSQVELLTQGQAINVGTLDILGRKLTPGPDLYLKLMQYNTNVIKRCLNADMQEADKARKEAMHSDISDLDSFRGRFILTNQFGQAFSEQDMRGKYSLIFFGYTSCPDICPTNLLVITQMLKQLGSLSEDVQSYFITVDPERDSVEVLNKYIGYFDKRVTGLTGSPEMIDRVANQFKVRYEKGEIDPAQPDQYSVDHSSSFYLLAPDGSFLTKFAYGIDSKTLAAELEAIMK